MLHFLWNGKDKKRKYHLARWDLIMRPKERGRVEFEGFGDLWEGPAYEISMEGADVERYLERNNQIQVYT